MSVKGNLDSIGLEELLRAELASQGAGRLTLRNGAHYAALHLVEDGVHLLHPDLLDAEDIVQAFVDRGILDPEKLAKTRRRHASGIRLLDALTGDGAIAEAALMEILAAEAEDNFLDLMLWDEGLFTFERERIPGRERGLLGRISVDPEGLCERADQRIGERRGIAELFGKHALLFIPFAGDLPPLQDEHDIAHALHARLDGRVTTHELALELGVGRFTVLQALARLATTGLVRPATAEELEHQATIRGNEGKEQVARALVLQWVELAPTTDAPLKKLVSLAATGHDPQAQLEALCALGHHYLRAGKAGEAIHLFTEAMRKAPADEIVLAGLRLASEATGNNDSLVDGTLLIAQTKVDEGAAEEALELLAPVALSHPDNIGLHLLKARALVMLEKRSELLEQAELVGQVLGRDGCQTSVDREAVEFFRTAIESVAPDRGDLLERFRSLYDPRKARRRRWAIGFALVLVVCSAGFYFWPASAATLLARAEAAANAGEKDKASILIAELTSRFPDAPEVQDALILQNRLFPHRQTTPRRVEAEQALRKKIRGLLRGLKAALLDLPSMDAQHEVRKVLEVLETAREEKVRNSALNPVSLDLRLAAARLRNECDKRVKLLAQAAGLHDRHRRDPEALREFLAEADRQRDAAWITDLRATAELLQQLVGRHADPKLLTAIRDLEQHAESLKKTAAFYDVHAKAARVTLAGLDIEEADRRCREDAPKLMVGGHLVQADAVYERLEMLIALYKNNPIYAKLIDSLVRRQIPDFIADRRKTIRDIREDLAAAEAAEKRGDLEKSVRIRARLIQEYWLIRFEKVFTFPLLIRTVPPGANVLIDGRPAGRSPAIVRYAWSSDATVQVGAPGWTSRDVALRTADRDPSWEMEIRLAPAPLWRCEKSGNGTVGAIALGENVLRADRTGLVSLHRGRDGEVLWSAEARSLEGVRGRPAVVGKLIYVPRVDGQVRIFNASDGVLQKTLDVPRPKGHMAAQGDAAAMATADGELIVLRNGREAFRVKLDSVPTAGVIGAHGAFWIGTARGTVIRVGRGPNDRRVISVAGGNVPIGSLVATPSGMLLSTADGALVALSVSGDQRWRTEDVGDLVGAPARAGDLVAVVNRAGHVSLFNAKNGESAGSAEMGKGATHGLLGAQGVLIATRQDGSLWVYDLASKGIIADVPMGLDANVTPTLLREKHIVLGLADGCVGLFEIPHLP